MRRIGLPLARSDIKATARNFTIPLSFLPPIFMLYFLDPDSFQWTWKGRAPYLFFLWLLFLACIRLHKNTFRFLKLTKVLAVAATAAIPTAYVTAIYFFGLSHQIVEIGKLLGAGRHGEWFLQYSWPLSLEYLLFTFFLAASIQLVYRVDGLKRCLIPLFFLGATGTFYMIDTFYPYKSFTTLQALVPFTASSAARVLNWMGYEIGLRGVFLIFPAPGIRHFVALNWPCAGIHSLLIYTFIILLFLKESPFPLQREVVQAAIPKKLRLMAKNERTSFLLKHKLIRSPAMVAETFIINVLRIVPVCIIVAIGALGTFIANVLRIVSISIIVLKSGPETAVVFHSYYGELFFIAWIMIYLTILLLLIRRIRPRQPMFKAKPSVT